MNKMKFGSVIACVIVILLCAVYYSWYVSQAIYDVRTLYPKAEGCSAEKISEMPEGYFFRYYGDYEDLGELEVVEVTWLLSNITNEQIEVDDFWSDYDSMDGSRVYVLEKEDLAIRDYENKKIIPPGEQTVYTEYVIVAAGSHEINAVSRQGISQRDGEQTFTLTF